MLICAMDFGRIENTATISPWAKGVERSRRRARCFFFSLTWGLRFMFRYHSISQPGLSVLSSIWVPIYHGNYLGRPVIAASVTCKV